MTRVFVPLVLIAMVLFASAPLVVANAPVEQTMGLVQKIFYYHVPSAMLLFVVGLRVRHRERRVPVPAVRRGRPRRPGGGRTGGALRPHRPGDRADMGPQGVGGLVGMGRAG